jgi:hypothetical protein
VTIGKGHRQQNEKGTINTVVYEDDHQVGVTGIALHCLSSSLKQITLQRSSANKNDRVGTKQSRTGSRVSERHLMHYAMGFGLGIVCEEMIC